MQILSKIFADFIIYIPGSIRTPPPAIWPAMKMAVIQIPIPSDFTISPKSVMVVVTMIRRVQMLCKGCNKDVTTNAVLR